MRLISSYHSNDNILKAEVKNTEEEGNYIVECFINGVKDHHVYCSSLEAAEIVAEDFVLR